MTTRSWTARSGTARSSAYASADARTPAAWLGTARGVVFDFDGPVCSLFAGFPAAEVASVLAGELAELLSGSGLPGPAPGSDPHALLVETDAALPRTDPGTPHRIVRALEARLGELEAEAAVTAEPTPGLFELVELLRDRGLLLAVASNNGLRAVRTHLDKQDLARSFTGPLVGRDPDPRRMKPAPSALERVVRESAVRTEEWVFVGDSLADLGAARSAGMRFVGYTSLLARRDVLRRAGAPQVVVGYAELLAVLRNPQRNAKACG